MAFGIALVAVPSAQAATTQIAKDRQAVNVAARSFLKLISDAPRAKATVTALKAAGYDVNVAAQSAALSTFVESAAFPGSAVDAIFTKYYGAAPSLAYESGVTAAVLRTDVAYVAVIISTIYETAGITNAAQILGSPTGWSVGTSSATIYDADLVKKFQSGDAYAVQLILEKKNGTWLVNLNKLSEGKSYKKPPTIKTAITGFKAKTLKVKKGKAVKPQSLTIPAATGSITLQTKVGKKWKAVKAFKVNTSTGKVKVSFPKQKNTGKFQYRVILTGTNYYTAKTPKTLTVNVK